MVLSIDVLDEVLNEIGRGPDVRVSQITRTVQELSDSDLRLWGSCAL